MSKQSGCKALQLGNKYATQFLEMVQVLKLRQEVRPCRYCSPRHDMPFDSIDEGSPALRTPNPKP